MALILVSPIAVQADLIRLDDGAAAGTWEVDLVEGTFADLESLLTDQTWWGDYDLAAAFAAAYSVSLPGSNGLFGPYFAYDQHDGWFGTDYADVLGVGAITGWIWDLDIRSTKTRFFAVASRVGDAVSIPEPGTMGLLGLGLLALGRSRRRNVS